LFLSSNIKINGGHFYIQGSACFHTQYRVEKKSYIKLGKAWLWFWLKIFLFLYLVS